MSNGKSKKEYIPRQGDIVWINLDPQARHEQAGHRPAIVMSKDTLNQMSDIVWIVPITNSLDSFPTHVDLSDFETSIQTTGTVLCEHLSSVDYKARNMRFKEKCSEDIFLEVQDIVIAIAES